MAEKATLTGVERMFDADDIIVSKTDKTGKIIYCNRTFISISGFSSAELIGAPHSILRHPDMPRAIFKLLWENISQGRELFAYVVNRCKNGDHYWVLAHVTPSFGADEAVTGYHSSRRKPDPAAVGKAKELYAVLAQVERDCADRKNAPTAGVDALNRILTERKVSYEELVFSL